MKKVIFLVLVMSLPMFAQTTYSSNTPFICDMASVYHVTSFNQFSCRGVTASNATAGSMKYYFMYSSRNWIDVYALSIPGTNVFGSFITGITGFTQPSNGQPGTYSFDWQVTDADNVVHTGSASGTWEDTVVCGGRGCLWHSPKLLSNTITIDN